MELDDNLDTGEFPWHISRLVASGLLRTQFSHSRAAPQEVVL
jgi:hypothetical protein